MQDIHPVTGWLLNYIVALDVHVPGTAGAFLRASDERRQVVAALLAMQPFPESEGKRVELAQFISGATHNQILRTAYVTVPEGLRGALGRSGPQPHIRPYYRMLFRLLSSDAHAATVIHRLDQIDLLRLRIAKLLPPDICTPNLVKIVGTVRSATDIAKLVDLLTSNGIDRPALAEALRRVPSEEQLPNLWARWSQKLKLPPHPIPASQNYKPITSGEDLRLLALRYRNCARRYLSQVMDRESAFAEFECSGKRGVVHLVSECKRWKLQGLFAKDNAMVAPELRSAAVAYLGQHGVETGERRPEAGEWNVLRRLIGTEFILM